MSKRVFTLTQLVEVAVDVADIYERIQSVVEGMDAAGIAKLPIEYEKMATQGRLWLHRFASDATEQLRAAKAGVVVTGSAGKGKKPKGKK